MDFSDTNAFWDDSDDLPTIGDTGTIASYEAKFPKVEYAIKFTDRIRQPGWNVEGEVTQNGRTVTWTAKRDNHAEYAADLRETVGYYGSTQNAKATLNGIRCPISY